MQRKHTILLALGLAAASLSSCSRANYAFNSNAPAYLGSERAHTSASTEVPATAVATTQEAAPVTAEAAPAHQAATALAHRSAPAAATSRPATATAEAPTTAAITSRMKMTHADRKALRQELKRQLRAPENKTDSGKSQLVAVLLCFFLGGLGVHDFYMGYIGKGILQIILSILIVGFILVIIDFIRLLTGNLKPKDGDWSKTL